MCLLSSVLFRFCFDLNDALWFANLALKLVAVIPTYVSSLLSHVTAYQAIRSDKFAFWLAAKYYSIYVQVDGSIILFIRHSRRLRLLVDKMTGRGNINKHYGARHIQNMCLCLSSVL